MYIYIYIHTYMYIYKRKRERKEKKKRKTDVQVVARIQYSWLTGDQGRRVTRGRCGRTTPSS